MDINKALRELYAEKQRLDTVIAALEEHLRGLSEAPSLVRRGRKKMSPEERLAVSQRMSKYWEARRAQAQDAQAETKPPEDRTSASSTA